MTKQEQKDFVAELAKKVVADIQAKISEGQVPEHWDGIELRQYMADQFQEQTLANMGTKRLKDYRHAVLFYRL